MPRGDKSSYIPKQKRMAEHIEEGYEKRGAGSRTAEARAWATVNKETGGGRKASPKRTTAARKKSATRGSSSTGTSSRKK